MKKLLIAIALAAVCLGLLAAPAFADLRPSVKTASPILKPSRLWIYRFSQKTFRD